MNDKEQRRITFETQNCNDKVRSKGILSFVVSDTNKHTSVEDLKPSAHYARLCNEGTSPEALYLSNVGHLLSSLATNKSLLAHVSLLFENGLRVSEMLSANCRDMVSIDYMRIRGCKGSKDRLVRLISNNDYWSRKIGIDYQLGYDYNRFYIYRLFKMYGIYSGFGENTYNSVTHMARHMLLLKFKDKGLSDQELLDVLGHRSLNSLKYYMQDVKMV